ncbi:protein TonB [Pieris rapae]|uniref:protein TonB n=1 Tax=Pieris rapae TaxID=64459 RepID=UPI001E281046|nr:protein TonB [Pieris rapae]
MSYGPPYGGPGGPPYGSPPFGGHGGPPYAGYPPPPGVVFPPTVVMPMPVYPPPPHAYPPTHTYPPAYPHPQPQPPPDDPVNVIENDPPKPFGDSDVDWVPTSSHAAESLSSRVFVTGREGWDSSPLWTIRAHHNGNLIPGKLAIKHKVAYIPYAGKEVRVHNFEVLCTNPNKVRWIPSSNGAVPPGAIPAGNTQNAEPLYIGRVRHKGSLTPGKVHPSHNCCYISFDGSEVSYKNYEVLCIVGGGPPQGIARAVPL